MSKISIDKWNILSRNSFVPFCVALIRGERLPGKQFIPFDRKDALDLESVTALEGILRDGLLNHLVEIGGWRQQDVLVDDAIVTRRLWENDFSLKISGRTIQWLICLHNQNWRNAAKFSPVTTGDMLLFDYLYKQAKENSRFKIKEEAANRSRLTNFLNIESTDAVILTELNDILPWLKDSYAERWKKAGERFWKNRRLFTVLVKRHDGIIKQLLKDPSSEIYSFLCLWFQRLTEKGLNTERACLYRFSRDLHFTKERQALFDLWSNYLMNIEALHKLFSASTAKHPVEREERDNFAIKIWKDLNMNRVREIIISIKDDLTPGINKEEDS